MGRRENPIDPANGALARFAAGLRELRARAGNPTYRRLAARAYYSPSTLSQAASGNVVPSLPVTLAYVSACGGDPAEWSSRWRLLRAQLRAERTGRPVLVRLPADREEPKALSA
ncbi:MAG TPA: helix-turn-helix transcriptional regulator [Amycolatopsis sp.]|uniref:helix-turn-helix domain-containing protein n=1 Tax=Amycolatopsis sp. TaxID=37632 RepID=UPI002B49D758|nr:helix-turn-helix transcriptional regulator [Amycolatopsis sp.]HKS50006.1 helix-turn-helix transcriptional regulator [Amycolatopsis sp.]